MSDVIDGSFNDPEGRPKSFVRQREGESSEEFAKRAMAMFEMVGMGDVVDGEQKDPTSAD